VTHDRGKFSARSSVTSLLMWHDATTIRAQLLHK
jgi:hypothetical protein